MAKIDRLLETVKILNEQINEAYSEFKQQERYIQDVVVSLRTENKRLEKLNIKITNDNAELMRSTEMFWRKVDDRISSATKKQGFIKPIIKRKSKTGPVKIKKK